MIKKYIGLACAVILLAACSTASPYEATKTSADVPAHVDVIHLKRVFLYGGEADESSQDSETHRKPEPLEERDPSSNDREVLAMAKANILSQLTNLGYRVVEDSHAAADVGMSFAVSYMPERVFFVHRQVGVQGLVYDSKDNLLFRLGQGKASAAGLFGSMVQPRDDLVSECTREAVIKVVEEMRKGTLENVPVAKDQKQSVSQSSSGQQEGVQ